MKKVVDRSIYVVLLYICLFFVFIFFISSCSYVEESSVKNTKKEKVEVEEVEKEEVSIDLDRFDFIRIKVQNRLSVFDVGDYEKSLMELINSQISSPISRSGAEDIIDSDLEILFPQWHRQIVINTLNFEVGEGLYSQDNVQRLIDETSIKQLKPLVKAYAITKLKRDGKLK